MKDCFSNNLYKTYCTCPKVCLRHNPSRFFFRTGRGEDSGCNKEGFNESSVCDVPLYRYLFHVTFIYAKPRGDTAWWKGLEAFNWLINQPIMQRHPFMWWAIMQEHSFRACSWHHWFWLVSRLQEFWDSNWIVTQAYLLASYCYVLTCYKTRYEHAC